MPLVWYLNRKVCPLVIFFALALKLPPFTELSNPFVGALTGTDCVIPVIVTWLLVIVVFSPASVTSLKSKAFGICAGSDLVVILNVADALPTWTVDVFSVL